MAYIDIHCLYDKKKDEFSSDPRTSSQNTGKTTLGTQKIFSDKSENVHAVFTVSVSDQRTLSEGKADFTNMGSGRPKISYLNRRLQRL